MTKRMSKTDRAATARVQAYAEAYAVNRPFNSPERPDLIVAFPDSFGVRVYNRQEADVMRSTIATFETEGAALAAVRRFAWGM